MERYTLYFGNMIPDVAGDFAKVEDIENNDKYEVGHEDGYAMGRDVERNYWLQKLQEFLDLEIKRSKWE